MEYRLLTWNERDQWARCLEALPPGRQDIYYSPAYCRAAAGNLPSEQICAWYFAAGGETALYPFMLRPLRTLDLLDTDACDIAGFYGYNGALASTDDPAFAAAFNLVFDGFCRENRIVAEFTRFNPLLDNEAFFRDRLDISYLHDTVIVDLRQDAAERMEKSYDSRTRNMIRKAEKSGITCRPGHDWKEFRRLYWLTMDNCGASAAYYFDEEYFARLAVMPPGEGSCRIYEAIYEGKVIAAQLVMRHGRYAHYHLSARDPAYASLASGNLLLDYSIGQAAAAGAELMHLGGGRTASADDSLMRFKSGFSPRRGRFSIGVKAHDPEFYRRLCDVWTERYPELADSSRHLFLKYRQQPPLSRKTS